MTDEFIITTSRKRGKKAKRPDKRPSRGAYPPRGILNRAKRILRNHAQPIGTDPIKEALKWEKNARLYLIRRRAVKWSSFHSTAK